MVEPIRSAEVCGSHQYIERTLEDFKTIAGEMAKSQVAVQVSIAKLTESVEGLWRIDQRVDKIEGKVEENSKMMYKMVGIGMCVAAVVPVVLRKLLY